MIYFHFLVFKLISILVKIDAYVKTCFFTIEIPNMVVLANFVLITTLIRIGVAMVCIMCTQSCKKGPLKKAI